MENIKKVIYLFTAEYPFGKSESFIENELSVLEKKFETVVIFPFSSPSSEKRAVPKNSVVEESTNLRSDLNSKKILLYNLFFIGSVLFTEFWHVSKPFYFLKNIRQFNSLLIRGIYDAGQIKKKLKHPASEIIFLSYWMNDWALALAILKRKRVIDSFVFRCAGFDIYDERHKGGFLPFRYFVYKQASGIYPNSKDGENYIKNINCFPEKVKLQYLGTKDNGQNQWTENAKFTIVSCSNVIALKRIDLIIEILKNINFELNWFHFGDGNCMEEIKEKAKQLPASVNFAFKGRVTNQQIIEFYKTNAVHLFITTSETESLPVSIQEAISFGIPALATNVGGISEIVNEQTGFLIDKNVDVKKTAQLITDFKESKKNTVEFRKGVRNFWKDNFEAEQLFPEFYDELIKM